MSPFQPASRQRVKARVAIAGPSGSGKTFTALAIASGMGDRTALIDTEHESSLHYADDFTFDVLPLAAPYSPDRYIAAIREAAQAGYPVCVIDSLSHAWFAEGGVLDIVDKEAARSSSQNTYAAWRKGTPEQNKLIEAILGAPMHVIATLRVKTEYAVEQVNGRMTPRKIGLAPVQRDNVEYEFGILGEMDHSHTLTITKSRIRGLQDATITKPDASFGRRILDELQVVGGGQAAYGEGVASPSDSTVRDGNGAQGEPATPTWPGDETPASPDPSLDGPPTDADWAEGMNMTGAKSRRGVVTMYREATDRLESPTKRQLAEWLKAFA